ncbi:hypothetical protein GMLC_21720 [Geomonas limicola]|uniref:Uncharacterized protein n=1 Tax=Geomonas limicola TaxID=2740186 RepID=A0A6V8NAM0_9BACT|nr:hypothetical protein [Geomonas limicola]GFO68593.1 hypothetical protein GMLC_21720 [Geomonas limicola]
MNDCNIDEFTGTYRIDLELVDKLTALKASERNELLAWLGRQGEAVKLEAIRLQTDLLSKFNNERRGGEQTTQIPREKLAEVRYANLVLAVLHIRHNEKRLKRKGCPEALGEILKHRVARVKALKRGKRAPEREKFRLAYFQLVQVLRDEHRLSWREVAAYLAVNHRTTWAYGWIRQTYNHIVRERTLAGIENPVPQTSPNRYCCPDEIKESDQIRTYGGKDAK